MSIAIEEHDLTVYAGDVRDQLDLLAAGSVQCVVTSPPYFSLRDYGMPDQIGLERTPAEYVETMRGVFAEVRRVLADDGVLWLNLGDSYANGSPGGPQGMTGQRAGRAFTAAASGGCTALPAKNLIGVPWRTAFALQDDGWILRNAVVWSKPNAMPESVTDRLSCRYEHVFLFSKSRRYRFNLDPIREPLAPGDQSRGAKLNNSAYRVGNDALAHDGRRFGGNPGSTLGTTNAGGRNPGDVWTIPTAPFPGAHFACFPPDLARRCILAGSSEGDVILDPFAGSGTTLMVARKLARKSVGVELNPAYIDIIRERIGQTPLDFGEATA